MCCASSDSLLYCLTFDWGGNSLEINGRYEVPAGGNAERFFRLFRVPQYNSAGKKLNLRLLGEKLLHEADSDEEPGDVRVGSSVLPEKTAKLSLRCDGGAEREILEVFPAVDAYVLDQSEVIGYEEAVAGILLPATPCKRCCDVDLFQRKILPQSNMRMILKAFLVSEVAAIQSRMNALRLAEARL